MSLHQLVRIRQICFMIIMFTLQKSNFLTFEGVLRKQKKGRDQLRLRQLINLMFVDLSCKIMTKVIKNG